MSNKSLNTVKAALGLAIMSGSFAAPLAAHGENPFVINDLGSGYQVADNHAEGKCGEGKCGEGAKDTEGKCGESTKEEEGKCGGDMAKDSEGKCGGDAAKDTEGKCGEGKCGEDKQ